MLLYINCPTCGDFLTENYEGYETKLMKINNSNKSRIEKEHEKSKLINEHYPYAKMCCRKNIMSRINYHDVIVL